MCIRDRVSGSATGAAPSAEGRRRYARDYSMSEHVKTLGIIGLFRALLGAALAVILLWKASTIHPDDYSSGRGFRDEPPVGEQGEGPLDFDRAAFTALGVTCIVLALVR